jgi:hypothetical protein
MKPTIGTIGIALVALATPALAKDAVKTFEKAVKGGANSATLVEAAARVGDDLNKKGVKSLLKYGALVENIDVYLAARDALSNAKGEALAELATGVVKSKRSESRVLAADALGGIPGAESVAALGKALGDKEKPVRIAAIRALKRLERGDAVPHLFERLGEVGFDSADAEAEELYGTLFALTQQAYENLEDWKKWWETAGPDFDPKSVVKGAGDHKGTLTRGGEGKIFGSVVRSQAFVLCLDISSSMRVIDLKPGETWKDKQGKSHKYKDPDPSGRKKPHPDSRFEKAREAFLKFIEGMSARAKFTIVIFGAQKDTKPWKPKPVPANKKNKKEAMDFVKKLRYGYATRTDLALEEAFKIEGVDSIYLYSDGIPEKLKGGKSVPIPQEEILEKARTLNRTRKLKINTYGMASSKAMREFLRKLAEENDGEYQDIRVYADK